MLAGMAIASESAKPNEIYILADDLGYGEVGYNGQELIQTPELDTASRGRRDEVYGVLPGRPTFR